LCGRTPNIKDLNIRTRCRCISVSSVDDPPWPVDGHPPVVSMYNVVSTFNLVSPVNVGNVVSIYNVISLDILVVASGDILVVVLGDN
jgi:hypothetical protein